MKVDLNDFDKTFSAVKANPDAIFHLAAETHVDRSIENSEPFLQSNIVGTFNILESAEIIGIWINLGEINSDFFM